MKNLNLTLFNLIFVLILTSCDGPKQSTDKQSVSQQSDQPVVKSGAPAADPNNPADSVQATGNHISESLTGTQLVTNAANRLITKMGLNTTQETSIKEILTKTFLGIGENLNKSYTVEQSRTIGKDIIRKSSDAILGILDAKQQEQFKKFGNH